MTYIMKTMRHLSLTTAQEQTLSFIRRYIGTHHRAPTITELREALKLRSLRSVTQRLEALERKGFIRRVRFQQRSIQLLENVNPHNHSSIMTIPVIASAGCDAMEVFAQARHGEFLSIDSRLVPSHTQIAAIHAVGNSMLDAGIRNGDYVLVEVTEHVENGDRVVAVVGEMAVIKRYKRAQGIIFLQPENRSSDYAPIVVRQEDAKIFGRVLSVIPGSDRDDVRLEYEPGYRPPNS